MNDLIVRVGVYLALDGMDKFEAVEMGDALLEELTLENECLVNQADDLKEQLVIANRKIRNLEEAIRHSRMPNRIS